MRKAREWRRSDGEDRGGRRREGERLRLVAVGGCGPWRRARWPCARRGGVAARRLMVLVSDLPPQLLVRLGQGHGIVGGPECDVTYWRRGVRRLISGAHFTFVSVGAGV